SDEVIKSSVENLVPIPSESEGISDDTCDVPFCDNSHHLDVLNDYFELFSDFNDDCTSFTPLSDVNEDQYFSPGDDVELLLHPDPSTPMMSVVSILEGFTDEPPLEENDYLFDLESKKNEWKKILYDAPIDDLMTEDKVFDPGIHDNFFLQHELAEYTNTLGWNCPTFYNNGDDNDVDYTIAITPVLSIEEPNNSLSMRDKHLDTISTTESDEVIKSSIEDLVPITSESEGIPDTMCDVHLVNNPTPLEATTHFEIFINSNDNYSSSDEDSLYENIKYVEASPHDSELVSLEVEKIVIPKDEEIDDDNLHEKLLKVNLLIAKIKALIMDKVAEQGACRNWLKEGILWILLHNILLFTKMAKASVEFKTHEAC
nr:hypothetical protein [Tanacetum cinerariifolium]